MKKIIAFLLIILTITSKIPKIAEASSPSQLIVELKYNSEVLAYLVTNTSELKSYSDEHVREYLKNFIKEKVSPYTNKFYLFPEEVSIGSYNLDNDSVGKVLKADARLNRFYTKDIVIENYSDSQNIIAISSGKSITDLKGKMVKDRTEINKCQTIKIKNAKDSRILGARVIELDVEKSRIPGCVEGSLCKSSEIFNKEIGTCQEKCKPWEYFSNGVCIQGEKPSKGKYSEEYTSPDGCVRRRRSVTFTGTRGFGSMSGSLRGKVGKCRTVTFTSYNALPIQSTKKDPTGLITDYPLQDFNKEYANAVNSNSQNSNIIGLTMSGSELADMSKVANNIGEFKNKEFITTGLELNKSKGVFFGHYPVFKESSGKYSSVPLAHSKVIQIGIREIITSYGPPRKKIIKESYPCKNSKGEWDKCYEIKEEEYCEHGHGLDKTRGLCLGKPHKTPIYARKVTFEVTTDCDMEYTLSLDTNSDQEESIIIPGKPRETNTKGHKVNIESKFFKKNSKIIKAGYGFYVKEAAVRVSTDFDQSDGMKIRAYVLRPTKPNGKCEKKEELKLIGITYPDGKQENIYDPDLGKTGIVDGKTKRTSSGNPFKGYAIFQTDKNSIYPAHPSTKSGKRVDPSRVGGKGMHYIHVDQKNGKYPVNILFELELAGYKVWDTIETDLQIQGNMFEDSYSKTSK